MTKGQRQHQKLILNNVIQQKLLWVFLLVNEEISKIRSEMKSRQKQNHISFFGFTGTPKPQTLEVFGTPVEPEVLSVIVFD